MSESRNGNNYNNYGYSSSSSESRTSSVRRNYSTYSSESRDSGESRESIYSSPSEQYNNLEDIDRLIESLELSLPITESSNPRINKALEERKKQIAELKQLKEQSIRKMEEDRLLRQLESQNDEVQDAINGMKRLLKRKTTTTRRNNNSSESRDSGESRW